MPFHRCPAASSRRWWRAGNLTQGQQLGVVIPIAEDGLAVFLKLTRGDGENLTLRAPAQNKGRCRIASVRQSGRCLCHAGEIDVAAGQDLVLGQPVTSAKSHLSHLAFHKLFNQRIHLIQGVGLAILQQCADQVPPVDISLRGHQLRLGKGGGIGLRGLVFAIGLSLLIDFESFHVLLLQRDTDEVVIAQKYMQDILRQCPLTAGGMDDVPLRGCDAP